MRPAAVASRAAGLNSALAELRSIAQGRYREDIIEILGEPDDAAAMAVGRKLLARRTFSATVGVTGRIIRNYLRDGEARGRVNDMWRTFHRYRAAMIAVAVVARKAAPTGGPAQR